MCGVLAVILIILGAYDLLHARNRAPLGSTLGPATPPSTPYGTITKIDGSTITLSMQLPITSQLFIFTVVLTASSSITEQILETPAEFAAQQKAYQESNSTGTPPVPYTTKTISLSDIKVGMTAQAPGATKEGSTWSAPDFVVLTLPASTSTTPSAPKPPGI